MLGLILRACRKVTLELKTKDCTGHVMKIRGYVYIQCLSTCLVQINNNKIPSINKIEKENVGMPNFRHFMRIVKHANTAYF